MLKSIYIKNFALIDELSITWNDGLNIITGETGAGKSILLGALGLVLGDRASSDFIREGAEKSIVEATIDTRAIKNLSEIFSKNELDIPTETQTEMIVRREISVKGQSRSFINDSPVSLTVLREIGERCIDLHGQHEHQSLFRVESHIHIVDEYGNLYESLRVYRELFVTLKNNKHELQALLDRQNDIKSKTDIYKFQLQEIDRYEPTVGTTETLQGEEKILENSEKLTELTSALYIILYDTDTSLHNQLAIAKKSVDELSRIDQSFAEYGEQVNSAMIIVDDLSRHIASYQASIESSPKRLEEIRERLMGLTILKKKYGGTIENVIAFAEKLRTDLGMIENFDDEINKRKKTIAEQGKILTHHAITISEIRKGVAKKLSEHIESELKKLGILHAKFDISFSKNESVDGDVVIESKRYDANENGVDKVEFLISTNLGEATKSLTKIASGGEVSRVMLAIKSGLAKSSNIPVLIFDEIDTGVSGKIAQSVGFAMKKLADDHQILVITHLPQIAAMSSSHFRVEKESQDSRTISRVQKLSLQEHEKEVARLLSGTTVTEASLQSAKELIEDGKQYKNK